MKTLKRVFEFDSAHRVMNEKFKCFNLHGHRWKVELTFWYELNEKDDRLGYAIDFKEIKRLCGGFLDEHFDHATLLNPLDTELIELCEKQGWKLWVMGGGIPQDINPSAENLAAEIYEIMKTIIELTHKNVGIYSVKLYETPNCSVETTDDIHYFLAPEVHLSLTKWVEEQGVVNYDIRNE